MEGWRVPSGFEVELEPKQPQLLTREFVWLWENYPLRSRPLLLSG